MMWISFMIYAHQETAGVFFRPTCWSVRAQRWCRTRCVNILFHSSYVMSMLTGSFSNRPSFHCVCGALCVLFVWQVFLKDKKNKARQKPGQFMEISFRRHWVCLLEGVQSSPGAWGAIRMALGKDTSSISALPKEWSQLKTLGEGALSFHLETRVTLKLFTTPPLVLWIPPQISHF